MQWHLLDAELLPHSACTLFLSAHFKSMLSLKKTKTKNNNFFFNMRIHSKMVQGHNRVSFFMDPVINKCVMSINISLHTAISGVPSIQNVSEVTHPHVLISFLTAVYLIHDRTQRPHGANGCAVRSVEL